MPLVILAARLARPRRCSGWCDNKTAEAATTSMGTLGAKLQLQVMLAGASVVAIILAQTPPLARARTRPRSLARPALGDSVQSVRAPRVCEEIGRADSGRALGLASCEPPRCRLQPRRHCLRQQLAPHSWTRAHRRTRKPPPPASLTDAQTDGREGVCHTHARTHAHTNAAPSLFVARPQDAHRIPSAPFCCH